MGPKRITAVLVGVAIAAGALFVSAVPSVAASARPVVYGVSPFFSEAATFSEVYGLQAFDPVSGGMVGPSHTIEITSGPVTGPALTATALTLDPGSGDVYAMLNPGPDNDSPRYLSTIDLGTGEATSIAQVMHGINSQRIAGLTFDEAGTTLYGITGNGGQCPACLFTINKATGVATLAVDLPNGFDGEALAINPVDDKLYRIAGADGSTPEIQSIDPANSFATADIPFSGGSPDEPFGLVYDPTVSGFIMTDISAQVWTVLSDGTATQMSTFDDFATRDGLRGFVLRSSSSPVAVDDRLTVAKATGETAIDVLANDIDGTIDPVGEVVSFTQPTHGVVEPSGDDLAYDPDNEYCNSNVSPGETDRFTYTLDSGTSAVVRVRVTCPTEPSTLTLSYSKTKRLFKGTVGSTNPDCLIGRVVTVFRVTNNAGNTFVDQGLTDATGAYRIKEAAKPGKYVAEVDFNAVPRNVNCTGATSPQIRVR